MTTDGHDHVDPAPDPEPTPSLYEGLTPPGQVGQDPSRGFVATDLPPDEHVAEEVRACTALRDATEAEVQAAAAAAIQASNDETCRRLGQSTDAELVVHYPHLRPRLVGDEAHDISIDRAMTPPGIASDGDRVVEPYTSPEMLEAVTPTDKDYLVCWTGNPWTVDDIDREVRARGGCTRVFIGVRDIADQVQVFARCDDPDTPSVTPITLYPGEWLAYCDRRWAVANDPDAAAHTVGLTPSDAGPEGLTEEEGESLRALAAEGVALADEVHQFAVDASRVLTPPPRDTTAARRAARARTREVCETLQAVTITATLPVVCVLAVLILLRVFLWMG